MTQCGLVHKCSWQPMLGAGLNLMCVTNEKVSWKPYYIIVWIQHSGVTIQYIPSSPLLGGQSRSTERV